MKSKMNGTCSKMISILYHCCCFFVLLLSLLNNHVIAHPLDATAVTATANNNSSCNPDDQKALVQIKDHFHNVYPFSEWNPENRSGCCGWEGLACRNDSEQAAGRITFLMLYKASGVAGEIPAVVGELPFLTTLQLNDVPNLRGRIPATLTKLTNLAVLTICFTSMSGRIPDFLGHIKSLRVLELFSNQFSGSIPSSLSLLHKLYKFDLSRNKLSGKIPESFGAFKTGLTLRLQGNNGLSGEIPKSLGEANITSLDLSFNQLVGDASFLFGKNKPLNYVVLRQNRLKFNFSNVDPPLGLNWIDIAYNQIYGSIPKQFGQMHQWKYVNMSYNQLCGKVPKGRWLKQFSPSGFAHNKCLCDAPGLPPCT